METTLKRYQNAVQLVELTYDTKTHAFKKQIVVKLIVDQDNKTDTRDKSEISSSKLISNLSSMILYQRLRYK